MIGAETRCEIHPERPAVACVNGIVICRECDTATRAMEPIRTILPRVLARILGTERREGAA